MSLLQALPGSDPSSIPLAGNPNGDPPNFEGGATLQWVVLATGFVFIPISTILIIIRLGMSLKHSRKLHLDDFLCVLGEAFGIAYWVILYKFQAKTGLFKHTWDVPVSAITFRVFELHFAGEILNMIAHAFVKLSIPAFFIRVFGSLKWLRHTSYVLIVAVVIFSISPLISMLVVCLPIPNEHWNAAFVATCATSAGPQTITLGVFAVIFDITVVIIPICITSRLIIDRDKKRNLIIVFLIGFLVVATSVTGLAYRIIVRYGDDPLWNDGNIAITSYTEIFGTAIVGCAPGLRSFWLALSDKKRQRSEFQSRREKSDTIETVSSPREFKNLREVPLIYYSGNKYYYKHLKHLHLPSSTRRDTDQLTPLTPIHQSTMVLQQSSDDTPCFYAKHDGYWGGTAYESRK
ncbi:hypothetical protein F5Y00DRAFT_267438 [Daldinia vernicosa]|uniref:uncharacterized protein n=1 Tax=Daldinia vernicosa TaxID=114800 RepID=UPI002007DF76|nr:uncharacterized protein F5Y00DRAFT_267438 [Daldinia vernicosa]KAI0854207.1 hypothetical protein F5Y00DRAFT_267438 [Daldinia vernicosa]